MVLLDTHTLLWLFGDSENLSARAREAMDSQERCISIASLWEIAIKKSLADPKRRLYLDLSVSRIAEECEREGIQILAITPADCERVEQLPHIHEDPFDRIILSQAMGRGLALVTRDERMWKNAGVETVW